MSRCRDPYCRRSCCYEERKPNDPPPAHPARPVEDLCVAHALGKEGLRSIFRPGTLWYYGPFLRDNGNVLVRVTERGPKHSGKLCDMSGPTKGQPTWFIEAEVVESPFSSTPPGHLSAYPPHTLIPYAAVSGGFEQCPRGCGRCVDMCMCRRDTYTTGCSRVAADAEIVVAGDGTVIKDRYGRLEAAKRLIERNNELSREWVEATQRASKAEQKLERIRRAAR